MPERRYSEDEVAEIFKLATEQQQSAPMQLPAGEGMTLAQLQEIGKDVGITPDAVARAASALTLTGRTSMRRFLGFTVGVGRTTELGRRITDEEWERLVVDLRETFDARGTVRTDGNFRQWTNGNLQALVEPTPTGHQLRLRTVNQNARTLLLGGIALLGLAVATSVAALASTGILNVSARVAPLVVIGSGIFAIGALRLPPWARERARQMAEVASRFAALK